MGQNPSGRDGALCAALSTWYEQAARQLPWRADPSPYRVWVSEVMLQQTQVATVLPYFARFVARFPDVAALAQAPEEDVLKVWEGLGYYRRARYLHKGARAVVERFGGDIPSDPELLLSLPGVGPYTAGAIATFAFGKSAPAVDGNVCRVAARLAAADLPAGDGALLKAARRLSERLMAAGEPFGVGQALMELGALVCTPRRPRCGTCPFAPWCEARRLGRPEGFPRPKGARAVPAFEVGLAVVAWGGAVALERRPAGLLGNMWGFPVVEVADAKAWLPTLQGRVEGAFGPVQPVGPLGQAFTHRFTHRAWRVHPYGFAAKRPPRPPYGAFSVDELGALSMGRPFRRVADALLAAGDPFGTMQG